MLYWLLVIILAYLFFSFSFFGDKLVLSGPPNPKLYTLYVGGLNIVAVFLIPFTDFGSYSLTGLTFALLTGFVSVLGLYTMFTALRKFEVSRVMSTIGAIQPIFILVLTGVFWGFGTITSINFLAFTLLLAGSIMISLEKKLYVTGSYLVVTISSALMFSLAYVFSKLVFLHQSFLQGLVLISVCTFGFAMFLLLDKSLRGQVFSKKPGLDKKTGVIFLFSQMAGGVANILQSLAISLVPVSYLAIVNSLRGFQYIFLFLITLFFSFLFPHIFKEDISARVIIQKAFSILLIVAGLAIFVL